MYPSCLFPPVMLLFATNFLYAQEPAQTFPGTQPLLWSETEHADMADRLMDGAHRFAERKIAEAASRRARHWHRDFSEGIDTYEASIEPNRTELKRLVGVVDERSVILEQFGHNQDSSLVAETDVFRIRQVRWQSVKDVWCEGLWVEPKQTPTGYVVVVPDADQSPEQLVGLRDGIEPRSRTARQLAERGFMILIPTLVNRQKVDSNALAIPDAARRRLARADQTHREWLYRQSYHMGRHIIGYEVQHVLAAVDWLRQSGGPRSSVGVAGYCEGGLIALYAAAVDKGIDAALVSGYFDWREETWKEPVYRNIWSQLDQFGDAEVAGLIAPRGLVIEHSPTPTIQGHKGQIQTPVFKNVRKEYDRLETLIPASFQSRELVSGQAGEPIGPGSAKALQEFVALLGVTEMHFEDVRSARDILADRRTLFDPTARHLRQLQQIENHVQRLVRNSVRVREAFYSHKIMPEIGVAKWSTVTTHPTFPVNNFAEASRPFRALFTEQVMGRFDEPLLSANPRSRLRYKHELWTGYEVVLDVFEELVAWGVLLIPKDLRPGERRPVVVTQHGRNGLPENLIVKDNTAYRRVAARLVEQGYIVFVPHNLYRTESRYRSLNRKANTVGVSLYSFLVHQHDQILRWLNTLDFVDEKRIAFYGNSFGGETALRVPPVLEGYALSICASFFNQWTRKVAGANDEFSFMFSDEWETPVFNAGHTFDHAEMVYLMIPRPFMVERGHHDHVAHDRWVAHEYAKVRRVYAMLGIPEKTEIEFFQGGHGMRQEGSFQFLSKHLNWPEGD